MPSVKGSNRGLLSYIIINVLVIVQKAGSQGVKPRSPSALDIKYACLDVKPVSQAVKPRSPSIVKVKYTSMRSPS